MKSLQRDSKKDSSSNGLESNSGCASDNEKDAKENRVSGEDLFPTITPEGESQLRELARISSRLHDDTQGESRLSTSRSSLDTFRDAHHHPMVLDPDSDKFDLPSWFRFVISAGHRRGLSQPRIGITFRNLDVYGSGSTLLFQHTVASSILAALPIGTSGALKQHQTPILHNMNGTVDNGELLLVLGRPGSGCSTLLKTITGVTEGLKLGERAVLEYKGVPQKTMVKQFQGEILYNQEVDRHFPHLTVGQTLEMAASYRAPAEPWNGMTRVEWTAYIAKVVMAVFGLSHTYNTKVGNDFLRGVSGGERKRVSIAEMAIAGSHMAAWDNSTRGLDSATALEFVKAIKTYAVLAKTVHIAALYQASEAIYQLFDKVTVLYEGRQIFFGSTARARSYFEEMGWLCPPRQTTADFLTAITNPTERQSREGMTDKVPRTSEEFEKYWLNSADFHALSEQMERDKAIDAAKTLADLEASKHQQQSKHTSPSSPYMIPITTQIMLNTRRAYLRVWQDKAATVTTCTVQVVQALIVGSIFYGTKDATQGFRAKAAALLFSIIVNALVAIAEIQNLYDQRPIVEKHKSYAFYRPFTEAVGGIVADIPVKFIIGVAFNVTLYFLSSLRREPGQFFLYFLVTYLLTMTMTALFRFIAASTKTIAQALAMAGVTFLIILTYSGFLIPVSYMKDWFKWLHRLNLVFYAYEMVVANEFHNRNFTCSDIIPAYDNLQGTEFVCNSPGAIPGRWTVLGDDFISANYDYSYSHVWRNFGIIWAFQLFFLAAYFVATEYISGLNTKAEALVFRRNHLPDDLKGTSDPEAQEKSLRPQISATHHDESFIPPQKSIFTWKDVVYDIKIKSEERRLLDNVCGWVKPGTLTALMGASGAGKTTLLDVLAQRISVGVVSGSMMVDGKPLDPSFQRKTGYVQQQDLHLGTATVRESLRFSALMRQPKSVPVEEKYAYVENVIKTLGMESFAEAVVGHPGEGLNVEQRKRLTVGVELAAKPDLLLFLDEPTSGLDSQSSWEIGALLRKLASGGQAVLCTIHQPSAVLFQQFDRLLFLAPGGRTVYFGEIGNNSETMLNYFERNGARKCDPTENPAEYMLEIVGAGPRGSSANDWPEVWKRSAENNSVQQELGELMQQRSTTTTEPVDVASQTEFAMPFSFQLYLVTHRVFQQYWRTPAYIWSKIALGTMSGLFIGFSFYNADHSVRGTESLIFSLFTVTSLLATLAQQVFPMFVSQRSLYEVRERPAKAYSWKAFMIANIIVEIPYQVLNGVIVWATFYYPINGVQSSARQLTVLAFTVQFFIYSSSFAHLVIAAMPDAESASHILTLLFVLIFTFNGVMQPPDALPGFWVFMWRVSPLGYWINGVVGTIAHDRPIECSRTEMSVFDPPAGQTCGQYLDAYLQRSPGRLANPNATAGCEYCPFTFADQYISVFKVDWGDRWRNFGIVWVYVAFNIAAATLLYYVFRVKKWRRG